MNLVEFLTVVEHAEQPEKSLQFFVFAEVDVQILKLIEHSEKLSHHVTETSHSNQQKECYNYPLDVTNRIIVPQTYSGESCKGEVHGYDYLLCTCLFDKTPFAVGILHETGVFVT
jgi:hypothetical protein